MGTIFKLRNQRRAILSEGDRGTLVLSSASLHPSTTQTPQTPSAPLPSAPSNHSAAQAATERSLKTDDIPFLARHRSHLVIL